MLKANSPPLSPQSELAINFKALPTSQSDLAAAVASAKQRFVERNPISAKLFQEATEYLPGGNTRTLLYSAPFPLCMKKGVDYKVIDEDGHTYTDFVGEMTAGLYGHSQPLIQKTLIDTITNMGMNLGSTIAQESTHAKLICSRFHLDKVRFTNSGTEANIHALAGARFFTGKRKVVVFTGGYHGAVLGFWDGVQVNGIDRDDFVIARYNDIEGAKKLIESGDIAAVLVEGMQGAGGYILASQEFLTQVQESAKKVGAVFILDEVMTSRLSPSGIKSILNLSPDLTTFGKYLGGGITFGAFGGRGDIMAVYDPRAPNSLAHSGTFNNNTLAMHAGYIGLSEVWTPDVAIVFNAMGDEFREALQKVCKGTKMSVTGRGSLNAVHISRQGTKVITCKEDIEEDYELKELFFLEMMEEGFWISKRGSTALILGTPKSELDRFVVAVEKFLERYEALMSLSNW